MGVTRLGKINKGGVNVEPHRTGVKHAVLHDMYDGSY